MNIGNKKSPMQIRTIVCLFVGSLMFCNGSSVTNQPVGCAFLSDSRHYLFEQIITETQEHPFLDFPDESYTRELHYKDMVTGKDTVISSMQKKDFPLLQGTNPSDSTFAMISSDSTFICLKDDLSKTVACQRNRYFLNNGTVAIDCGYDQYFTATDLSTEKVIPHPDFWGLCAFHNCGILLVRKKLGEPDSLMIQELSGSVRAATLANGFVRGGVYAGNNTFAYSTFDKLLHFIDAQDLHEISVKKFPEGMSTFSISPDGKKLLYVEHDGESGLWIEDLKF